MRAGKAKLTLTGLGLLFALPLVLAWLMYSGVVNFRPATTSNRGTLVEPPLAAEWPAEWDGLGLERHWIVLFPVSLNCAARCIRTLTDLRQVVRALGREGARIRVVVLAQEGAHANWSRSVAEVDAEFLAVTGEARLQEQLRDIGGGQGAYIVDPLGNIMMHYAPGADANDIRLDLDHLLKYGKTDPQ